MQGTANAIRWEIRWTKQKVRRGAGMEALLCSMYVGIEHSSTRVYVKQQNEQGSCCRAWSCHRPASHKGVEWRMLACMMAGSDITWEPQVFYWPLTFFDGTEDAWHRLVLDRLVFWPTSELCCARTPPSAARLALPQRMRVARSSEIARVLPDLLSWADIQAVCFHWAGEVESGISVRCLLLLCGGFDVRKTLHRSSSLRPRPGLRNDPSTCILRSPPRMSKASSSLE